MVVVVVVGTARGLVYIICSFGAWQTSEANYGAKKRVEGHTMDSACSLNVSWHLCTSTEQKLYFLSPTTLSLMPI